MQVTCQIPLKWARRSGLVRTWAGAGPAAVADEIDGPQEHRPGPHQRLAAELESGGPVGGADRRPDPYHCICAVRCDADGICLIPLDVFGCEFEGQAEAGYD